MGDTPMLSDYVVSVIRLRDSEPKKDQDGVVIPGSGITVSTDLSSALFAPGNTSEPVAAGVSAVISQPTLYWRGNVAVDVIPTDRLTVNGTTYMVEGKPAVWPLGTVITLKAVESK